MESYYQKLGEALSERLALIADHQLRERDPALQLEKLKEASARIDDLEAQLPANADPMLVHYLQRKSLSKALEYLQERKHLGS